MSVGLLSWSSKSVQFAGRNNAVVLPAAFFAIFNMRLLLLNITIIIIIVVFVVNIILCTAFTSLILNK